MKKLLSLLLVLMLLASAAGAVDLYVDLNPIDTDAPPAIVDGRTLVPVRAIFEAIGAAVVWDGSSNTVAGARGATTIIIQINSTTAYVNNQVRILDVPAQLVNGRAMVPARFISEALGCDVTWDGKTGTAAVAYRLKDTKFYAASTEDQYHYDGFCGGGTYYEATLAEVDGRGLTPCGKCVLANSDSGADGNSWTTLPMPPGEVQVEAPDSSASELPDGT